MAEVKMLKFSLGMKRMDRIINEISEGDLRFSGMESEVERESQH